MGSPRLEDTLGAKPVRASGPSDAKAGNARPLGVGETIVATESAQEIFRISGASSLRVRFKATKAGTLYVAILKHDQSTEQVDPAPKTIPVLDATEVLVEFDDIVGESYVLIKFTAGAADSDITYCDLYRSFNPQTEPVDGSATDTMAIPAGAGTFAPEVIYLNRDHINAGVASHSDLASVSELQVHLGTLVADVTVEVDLLVPGGDPATPGDWLIAAAAYTIVGLQAPLALARWGGVRIRGKSGGTADDQIVSVAWW